MQELRQKVEAKVAETVRKIETLYGTKMSQSITIRYDINSARLGGQAQYRGFIVRLNPAFLQKYKDEYMQTVIHEVAHLGVYQVYHLDQNRRVDAHGPEWKNMMRRLGARPDRCHSYEAEPGQGRSKTKYGYKCSICSNPIPVGPKVHAKLQQGALYTPKCCGRSARLIFVASVGAVPTSVAAKMMKENNIPSTPSTPPATKTASSLKAPNPSSKLGKCYAYYKQVAEAKKFLNRQQWIHTFVFKFECTPSGASTYLNTCVKLFEAGV